MLLVPKSISTLPPLAPSRSLRRVSLCRASLRRASSLRRACSLRRATSLRQACSLHRLLVPPSASPRPVRSSPPSSPLQALASAARPATPNPLERVRWRGAEGTAARARRGRGRGGRHTGSRPSIDDGEHELLELDLDGEELLLRRLEAASPLAHPHGRPRVAENGRRRGMRTSMETTRTCKNEGGMCICSRLRESIFIPRLDGEGPDVGVRQRRVDVLFTRNSHRFGASILGHGGRSSRGQSGGK